MGLFWSLRPALGEWVHDLRDPKLRHADQATDTFGLPFGEITLVGDFDGDGFGEIALQLDGSEFWPQFSENSDHSLLVYKYDPVEARWKSLGVRSPNANGIASPQAVFPVTYPIKSIFAANLEEGRKQCLVSWGDSVINALQYDEVSNTFLQLSPIDFSPPTLSTSINQATGSGELVEQKILSASPLRTYGRYEEVGSHGKDAILIVSSIKKKGRLRYLIPGPELRNQPFAFPDQGAQSSGSHQFNFDSFPGLFEEFYYTTVSLIEYDAAASEWNNIPLTSDPNETHIILSQELNPEIKGVFTGDFLGTDIDDESRIQFVIQIQEDPCWSNRLYYITLHRNPDGSFHNLELYNNEVFFPGMVSSIRSGSFGIESGKTQLAWLSDAQHGNCVRFLKWNHTLRTWEDPGVFITHNRHDNLAIDLAVVEGFVYDPEQTNWTDVIALLMAKPDANIFLTYRYDGQGNFSSMGIL